MQNGPLICDQQLDFMSLILQGNFNDAIEYLHSNPQLQVDFHVNHPHTKSMQGITPLIMAAYFAHSKLFLALLERGAKIDGRDHSGKTALHAAVMGPKFDKDRESIIRKLVSEKRELLNYYDNWGNCPIHLGASMQRVEAVRFLLTLDNDMKNLKNRHNQKTPSMLLNENTNPNIELLALLAGTPSLNFIASEQIANDRELRREYSQRLPLELEEKVNTLTPILSKIIDRSSNKQNDDTDTVVLNQNLTKLKF